MCMIKRGEDAHLCFRDTSALTKEILSDTKIASNRKLLFKTSVMSCKEHFAKTSNRPRKLYLELSERFDGDSLELLHATFETPQTC